MNILEHYDVNKLKLSDPYNIDDDTFFCKFSYNNMPFVIKTNKICYLKKREINTNNYIYISLTSPDYLLWFEQFYKDCIQLFYKNSEAWFEEKLTYSDVEFSFINPLKSNIKESCFDIRCITDENRLHIIDSNENVRDLNSIDDTKVIPTFHIKGIKFNDKYFMFEIEVNNLFIILEENNESTSETETLVNSSSDVLLEPVVTNPIIQQDVVSQQPAISQQTPILSQQTPILSQQQPITNEMENIEDLQLSEHKLNIENLEESLINIDKNDFLQIYEIINNRIKIDIQKQLRNMFIQKTIKNEIDLFEMIDDEEDN
jgi:hypothetical protein